MDAVTHITLGVVVGEAYGRREVGRHIWWVGAVAQFLPDIDVLASLWLSPAENLLAHRGTTHSLLFITGVSPILALLVRRNYLFKRTPFRFWLLFFALQLSVHVFIDSFNAYGVGLLEPFNSTKFSFHTIYVVDPVFSCWIAMATIGIIFFVRNETRSRRIAFAAILTSAAYLGFTVVAKLYVSTVAGRELSLKGVTYSRLLVTPAPFTSLLWFVVASDKHGYRTTYRSIFDTNLNMTMGYHPKATGLLDKVDDKIDMDKLIQFSDNTFTVEQRGDTIVFNDLRFGQIQGWENPANPFVFHYYVNYPSENALVMQRGRFSGWNYTSFCKYIRRIGGLKAIRADENKM